MEKVKQLGELNGPLLLFGGAYSNFQALQKMYDVSVDLGIPGSHVINTGDCVAYCGQPLECIDLLKSWEINNIVGNVELQLVNNEDDCGCNFSPEGRCDTLSRNWYAFLKNTLTEDAINWMRTIPKFIAFTIGGKKVFVLHGSYKNISEFVFKSTSWEVKSEVFQATDSDVVIGGHCGLPFHDIQQDKYWLNPGVIGMPANDGTPKVWYMVLNFINGELKFKHKSFEYDYSLTQKIMAEKNLPSTYAQTLGSGLWDNCEILPQEEIALQGQVLYF